MSAVGIPDSYKNNFHAFELMFPSIEARHTAAMQLANPLSSSLPEDTHLGRNFLLAQWGEEITDLKTAAYGLYRLKSAIEHQVGQPITVLRRGSTDDILSDKDDRLEADVEIDFGILASSDLVHVCQGNVTQRGPKRMGIKPPFLGFGVKLLMSGQTKMNVDIFGNSSTQFTDNEQIGSVLVYIGAVPLEFNRGLYHAKKNIEKRQVLIGTKVCASLIEGLKHKTQYTDTYQALSNLGIPTLNTDA